MKAHRYWVRLQFNWMSEQCFGVLGFGDAMVGDAMDHVGDFGCLASTSLGSRLAFGGDVAIGDGVFKNWV